MNDLRCWFGAAAVGLLLTGCIVVSEPEEPPMVIQPGSAEAATLAEIQAAGKLTFDDSRTTAFKSIASRTNLSERAQLHLIDTVFRRLTFENSRITVLQALIENEASTYAAKQRLLGNISKFAFDSNRSAILRMLDKRGELKA